MRNFVTSDLHFNHTNIMKFCPKTRGMFKDVGHMNRWMVEEWNKTVNQDDTVYILGDFAFGRVESAVELLLQLNGKLILVIGNHDKKNLKTPAFASCFFSVHDYLEVTINGKMICMFHYPILEWNQMHRGSFHFYGHVHGNKTGLEKYRAEDVSFDAQMKIVSDIDNLLIKLETREIRKHHE